MNITHIIFCMWLADGQAHTVKEIAEYAKRSGHQVRKEIESSNGISHTDKVIPVIEHNYNSVMYERRVNAYQPSMAYLRSKLIDKT